MIFPEDNFIYFYQSILFLTERDTFKANESLRKFVTLYKEISTSEAEITTGLAEIYSEAGIHEKAEKCYSEALSLEPENPTRKYNLAKFLVEKDRGIDEGLALTEKLLGLNQDKFAEFLYSDTKGWGLYKQGKLKEAVELLERNWNSRPMSYYEGYLHLEEVKKAVASQKNN